MFAEDFDDDGGGGGGGRGRQQKPKSTKRGGMMFVKQGGSGAWGTSGYVMLRLSSLELATHSFTPPFACMLWF